MSTRTEAREDKSNSQTPVEPDNNTTAGRTDQRSLDTVISQ